MNLLNFILNLEGNNNAIGTGNDIDVNIVHFQTLFVVFKPKIIDLYTFNIFIMEYFFKKVKYRYKTQLKLRPTIRLFFATNVKTDI